MISISLGCKKDTVEPVGLFKANYFTSPDEDQVFNYYYDDGEFVAGGLDEYMVSLRSEAGTFSSEEIMLLKYTDEMGALDDSLIPFTYFTGMSYKGDLNKALEYRINYLYPYNNSAHEDNEELQFFLNNLKEMVLIELDFEEGADIYYDPNFTSSFIPYSVDETNNEIVFETSKSTSLYALCWPEERWIDSISFNISGTTANNTQTATYAGYRSSAIDAQGATYVSKDVLYLKYSNLSLQQSTSNDDNAYTIQEISIIIQNPTQGVIDHSKIKFDVLIGRLDGSFYEYTHLLLNDNTTVEILNWPNYREYGTLLIDGFPTLESSLSPANTTLEINFKRQR